MSVFSSNFPSFLECSVILPLSISTFPLMSSISFHIKGLPPLLNRRPCSASPSLSSLWIQWFINKPVWRSWMFIQHHGTSFVLYPCNFLWVFVCFLFSTMCLCILPMQMLYFCVDCSNLCTHPRPFPHSLHSSALYPSPILWPGRVVSVGSHKHSHYFMLPPSMLLFAE